MKTTLITVFVYVVLFSLVTIACSSLTMVILIRAMLSDKVTQEAFFYFKAIMIFCGFITTLVGVVTIGYIMLH